MYEGCFLQARFSKIINVSIDQKTWPRICFKTQGRAFQTLRRAFETLRENQKFSREFENLNRMFVL